MSDPALGLLLAVAGIVLLAAIVGALIAVAVLIVSRHGHDESGLGDEDVASILGYPTYPPWRARQNGGDRHDDEGAPT